MSMAGSSYGCTERIAFMHTSRSSLRMLKLTMTSSATVTFPISPL